MRSEGHQGDGAVRNTAWAQVSSPSREGRAECPRRTVRRCPAAAPAAGRLRAASGHPPRVYRRSCASPDWKEPRMLRSRPESVHTHSEKVRESSFSKQKRTVADLRELGSCVLVALVFVLRPELRRSVRELPRKLGSPDRNGAGTHREMAERDSRITPDDT